VTMGDSDSGTLLGKNAEISELINNLSRKNAKLERMYSKMGSGDTEEQRTKLEHERKECKKVAVQIMNAMKNNTGSDKQVMVRLSKMFETEFQKFTQLCLDIENKQKKNYFGNGLLLKFLESKPIYRRTCKKSGGKATATS